jgi:hypothetical protein
MDRTFDQEALTWQAVMAAIREADQQVPRHGRFCPYPDRLIVAMYLWAVWHDRNQSWACNRRHYSSLFRPRKLPSVSQFNRRCNGERFRALLQRVHEILSGLKIDIGLEGYLDGKALPVSPVSKDPDAQRGHVSGGFAKGYKLHAYVTADRRIPVWSVTGLNVAEQTVALEMVGHLPGLAGSLSLADSNYDSAPLHRKVNAAGGLLLTPLKNQDRVKDGQHHPVTLKQMGPGRREAVAVWKEHPELARYVMKDRLMVENTLSVLTVALDLRLPPWVRRQHRVQRWVGGKIILYHARLQAQAKAAA